MCPYELDRQNVCSGPGEALIPPAESLRINVGDARSRDTLTYLQISSRVRSSKKETLVKLLKASRPFLYAFLIAFESRFRVFVVYLVFSERPVVMQASSLQIHPSYRVDKSFFVECKGIEPLTLGLQSRCSPS